MRAGRKRRLDRAGLPSFEPGQVIPACEPRHHRAQARGTFRVQRDLEAPEAAILDVDPRLGPDRLDPPIVKFQAADRERQQRALLVRLDVRREDARRGLRRSSCDVAGIGNLDAGAA